MFRDAAQFTAKTKCDKCGKNRDGHRTPVKWTGGWSHAAEWSLGELLEVIPTRSFRSK